MTLTWLVKVRQPEGGLIRLENKVDSLEGPVVLRGETTRGVDRQALERLRVGEPWR